MRVPYTFLEVEAIERDYDEQVPLVIIADDVNRDFHDGNPVRSVKSVVYVMRRINGDDGWYSKLEDAWLSSVSVVGTP